MASFNGNIAVGLGVAAAATILAPVLMPIVAGVGRPLAKSLLKGGLMLYEKGREAVALAGEAAEDMVAEIRAEELAARGSAEQKTAARASPAADEGAAESRLAPKPEPRPGAGAQARASGAAATLAGSAGANGAVAA